MPRLRNQLLVAAGILLVAPFFLQRRPRVERKITICATPEAIFPLLNDLQAWPGWTAWAATEEMSYSYGAVTVGAGAEQKWQTPRMDGELRIIRSEPNSRIDYELEIDGGASLIRGRLDLIQDGLCTRVSWRCVWELAKNPYMRYGDLFCQWMIGRDFSVGLEQLKTLVEESAKPQAPLEK
jgi:Polyketide cyclase / dehydrase and lipid transport